MTFPRRHDSEVQWNDILGKMISLSMASASSILHKEQCNGISRREFTRHGRADVEADALIPFAPLWLNFE